MAGRVDSASAFAARARELQIDSATLDALIARGWTTFGNFAFSTAFAPQDPGNDHANFVAHVLQPTVGQDSPMAPALRRLWYEAQ
eukprot:6483253-Amphidinium_carterae.1